MENQNETKKCKHCQTEIPKKAKVCPNCRKKQGGIAKWVVIAVILIAIIGAATGEDDNSDNEYHSNNIQTTKTNQSEKNDIQEETEDLKETEENSQLTVGSYFEKKGLRITVNEANTDFQDYDNEYGWNTPDDGMKYVMVSFTFENNGDSDAYVSIYDFDCYADNTTCEQVYSLDDDKFVNTNLSPGRNVSFKTFYSVPISAQVIELEYETNMWTGEKVVIKI